MAADSVSPKVLGELQNAVLEPCSVTKFGGPFRATQLWNEVIQHLKDHVGRKRRRVKIKTYDNCFTGTDAVDTIYQRLTELKDTFSNKDVSRDKAFKLCQLMVEEQVFESVGSKRRRTELRFEDSSSKFFRFIEADESIPENRKGSDESSSFEEVSEARPINRSNSSSVGEDELSICDDSLSSTSSSLSMSRCSSNTSRHSYIVQEIMDMTGSWKRYSSERLRRKLTPARLFKSCPSLPATVVKPTDEGMHSRKIQPAVAEEIWREIALAQLLTLVDIPVLDPILSYDTTVVAREVAYSNPAFRRVESISSLFSEKEDEWLDTATACLESLPEGCDLLDKSLSEDSELTQKLRMYQSIVDHYRSLKEPLLPTSHADMHLALLNLFMQGKRDVVLRCVQLSMFLLPATLRLELRRLLMFMKCASDHPLQLSATEDSNRRVLEKTLTAAILHSKILTPHQCGQLVLFMMDNADKLAECPDEVEDLAMAKIDLITSGTMTQVKETTFCSRVSEAEYRKQKNESTDEAIIDLMNSIIDNTKISLKDKKHRLKQFQKAYPKLFAERFSDIKW